MKYFFIIFLSFCSCFLDNGSSKAAEKINLKFEEMKIPLNISQLSQLETYEDNSTEVISWLKKNGFSRVVELSKFLKFPVFKEEGLNRQVLRSWVGRKILSELSKTIIVANDKDGIEVFNTIESLLENKKQVSTLDIIKALPSKEVLIDVDNLISIVSSWKNELAMQQNLIIKLNNLEKTIPKESNKNKTKIDEDLIKVNKKIYSSHRVGPLEIELWKNKKESPNKELIIFMPGLAGDINNFKWIGTELAQRGWPIVFLDHLGTNSDAFTEVIEGKEAIPGSADFFLYRIKDLDAVLEANRNGRFGLVNDSYILMGHSLGALIALLYEGNKPIDGLENRCDLSLRDFAVTNLSKLIQCQLSEIPFQEKSNPKKANAIIGFNTFGSLIWPKEKSSGIDVPVLFIGGTFDLITPLINEQFKVFLSTNNSSNRFLIIEGASHFSPIRIDNDNSEYKDIFKIRKPFIGSNPISVQDLSLKIAVEFINKVNKEKSLETITNQRELNLDYHILDRKTIKEISKN